MVKIITPGVPNTISPLKFFRLKNIGDEAEVVSAVLW